MHKIEDVVCFLNDRELSVTTVESCTAGLAAAMMAAISGCGTSLQGGFVVYTKEAKHKYLDVSLQTIETYGLTSEEVAREMALGALKHSTADVILAITGTAESNDQLNGVVCFAYALRSENGCRLFSESRSFSGDRNQVRNAAAAHGLISLPDMFTRMQTFPEIPVP